MTRPVHRDDPAAPLDESPAAPGDALPVAPGLAPAIEDAALDDGDGVRAPEEYEPVNRRTIAVVGVAVVLAAGAGLAAQLLVRLIGLVTNVAFHARVATTFAAPAGGVCSGPALVLIPVLGALVVGVMARYGSA